MESFDYDCFAAVDQFCSNDVLDQEMKKASAAAPIDLTQFNESSEEILITGIEKVSNEEFFQIDEYDKILGKVSLSPRRLRKTTKNARSNRLDTVDLTNIEVSLPPSKRKKNNINIDLDDTLGKTFSDCSRNNSTLSDTDPDNLTINVQWDNIIEKLPQRKYQKFSDLMEIFSKRESCTINDILFNMDNQVISPDDTPHSINYKFYDIICGRVVPNCNKVVTDSMKRNEQNKNLILLKIQSSNWKKPLEISIEKNEIFSILEAKLAEELKLKSDDFTLIFDGEKLDLSETPNDLDFDGGELIDCKIKAESIQFNIENAVPSKAPSKRKAPARKSKRKRKN